MARAINRLTARTVTALKVPGRHADGGGLYLQVDGTLAKRWVFVFQWHGQRKEMGLGSANTVSLAEAHGFRSTFRDWAGDCTNFARELIEAALAHAVGNAVERAYRRSDAFAKRRRLMEAWSGYCARIAVIHKTAA